jgi:chemotaxis protein MotA
VAKFTEGEHAFYHLIRVANVAFIKGLPPSVAVEFGRRAISARCGQNSRNSKSI